METMILGRHGVQRQRLEQVLAEAGHAVHACHDRDWGCVGLEDRCPLDEGPIDVAVVLPEPGGRFDAQGVACAHRRRIPILAVGADAHDPIRRVATAHVTAVDEGTAAALERLGSDASGHIAAIEQALAERTEQGESVVVTATRSPNRLAVQLVLDADERRANAIADAARAAARGYDPEIAVIDVSVVVPRG